MVLEGSRISYPSWAKLLQLFEYPALELGRNRRGKKFVQLPFCWAAPPHEHFPLFLKQCGFTHSTQLTCVDELRRMRVLSQCFPSLPVDPLWVFVKSAYTDPSWRLCSSV